MAGGFPEAVERVARYLRAAGIEARLEEFADATRTAEEAANAVGCQPSQIVKSLVFICDDRAVLVMVPGDRRADAAKVAAAAGCTRARVARPDEVEAATGFAPGSVAPFPLSEVGRVVMERGLLQHERVWIGAGSPNHLAALAPGDLARLARAEAVDAVLEDSA